MKPVTRATSADEVAAAVALLQQGATKAGGRVTLTAGATSTTQPFTQCSPRSQVLLFPLSATAATAVGAGVVYVVPANRQFVVHHNNTADNDRTFSYLVLNTDKA